MPIAIVTFRKKNNINEISSSIGLPRYILKEIPPFASYDDVSQIMLKNGWLPTQPLIEIGTSGKQQISYAYFEK